MRFLSSSSLLAVFLALHAGCGSEVQHEPKPSASGGGEGGVGGMAEGGAPPEGGGGAGGQGGQGGQGGEGVGGGTTGFGAITLYSQSTEGGMLGGFAHELPPFCTVVEDDGVCHYLQCGNFQFADVIDGGAITLSGGLVPLTLSYDPQIYGYPSIDLSTPLFQAGQVLTVDVAGSAEVPPMHGTIEAVGLADLTSPDLTNLAVDLSEPFAFSWSGGGTAGKVRMMMVTPGPNDVAHGLYCDYPVTAGAGTVDVTMLAKLPPTADQGGVSFLLIHEVEMGAPGWEVPLVARSWLQSSSTTSGYAGVQDIPIQ
ncbi:MAG: hypothetical protein R3B72_17870 [Polyangiaceae bacterium]